jgi:hypothetical protein
MVHEENSSAPTPAAQENRSEPPAGQDRLDPIRSTESVPSQHFAFTVTTNDAVLETVVASDPRALQAGRLQHELGEGPCLAPSGGEAVFVSQNLAADPRWPHFGRMCAGLTGLRSMLTVQLPLPGHRRAALSFYAESSSAFDAEDAVAAARVARLASGVEAPEQADGATLGEPVLDTSRVVTKALAVVMTRYRVDSSDALDMLRDASQALGCRMLDLASSVVLNGRLPAREIWRARRERRARTVAAGGPRPSTLGYQAG